MIKYDPRQYLCVFCLAEHQRTQAEHFREDKQGFEQPVCSDHAFKIDNLGDIDIERERRR